MIRDWCKNIDFGRNLPLVGLIDGKIVGDATLHQQLGGWRRHIGRVSVLVHPATPWTRPGQRAGCRNRGHRPAGRTGKGRSRFIGEQAGAMKMFALLVSTSCGLENYVKDMQAPTHDYILMGLELKTDEEYTSAGG